MIRWDASPVPYIFRRIHNIGERINPFPTIARLVVFFKQKSTRPKARAKTYQKLIVLITEQYH
jgi:hypothetical protein